MIRGQLERITEDLATFLASRADYDRIGFPWHHGYLFEGPPGGGKSSVARVLAGVFNLDLWYLPLADIPTDTDVLRLIAEVRGGILLIEEPDVNRAATERTDDGTKRVTLGGLLNGLDGIVTPPGLITIMNTNAADALDPALVRPGRVDLREHFGPIQTIGQVHRMLVNAYGPFPIESVPDNVVGVMPAAIVGAIKANLRDPDAALTALKTLEPIEVPT